jgi:nucleoredoxin
MSKALLQGLTLKNAQGEAIQGETLGQDGKVLALYFAADWCPDCRAFQPALNDFYKAARGDLDVVFVGSDASAKDQQAHLADKQGPWWMVPFEGETRTQLKRKFGVCAGAEMRALSPITRKGGIPTLVVIRADGEVVDFHAADKVERDGIKALAKWQQ